MSPVTRSLSRLLACWLLLTAAGCATLNLKNIDFRSRKATARNPAIKVVCLWEPAEGRDPKGVPCQGFAGQILFLNSSSLPVSVEGDIKIYLFDDHGTVAEQVKPLHEFNFDSEAWGQHYGYGTLGPAYNVFIPYMRRGVNDATCALRLRLTPETGPALFSEMTSIKLLNFQSGGQSKARSSTTDSRVEETIPDNLTSTNKRRRTTTIVLDGKHGKAGEATDSTPANAGRSKVQLAAYEDEDDIKPLTNDDARIAQLEQMIRELRGLQGTKGNPSKVVPASATTVSPPPASNMPPRRLEEVESNRMRIRLHAVPVDANLQESQDESTSDRSAVKKEPRIVSESSHRHPLDDGSSSTAKSTKHPLDDADGPIISVGNSTAKGNRTAKRRHPLEEDDRPAPETATRKGIPSTKGSSQVDRDRSDPFDPIDTDAIETTSVQENRTRRQLRVNQ